MSASIKHYLMKKIKLIPLLLLIALCLKMHGQDIQKIDLLFQEMHNEDNFNGNVLVSKKGEILFKKSYGFSEIGKDSLTDNSIFNLASLTKQFTAAGIVLLARDGKLTYEDDIRTYIPELNFYPKITIRNLLNHTSGLYNYMTLADSLLMQKDRIIQLNNQKVIELFKENKPELNFQPNEQYEYSNTGYLLLATIIERISKETYGDYLKHKIFDPLQMNNTEVLFQYINPEHLENLTIGYQENENGKLVNAIEVTPEVFNYDGVKGQGRLYSTTLDLNKWSNALNNHFLSKSELDEISAISKTTNNEQINYGFGWYITNDLMDGKSIYHSGSWPGYITYIEKNQKHEITVIILQNVSTKRTGIPTYPLRKILYDRKELSLEESYLKSLAGEYKMSKGQTKKVAYKNNKLYAVVNPSFQLELIPLTKTIFEVKDFSPKVNFEFILENNSVKGYKFYQLDLGKEAELTKIE
jgi:CubicO group peptidase (beta-lactamase class C family)